MAKRIWFTFWGCLFFSLLAAQSHQDVPNPRALPEGKSSPETDPGWQADSKPKWPRPYPQYYYDFAFFHLDEVDSIQNGFYRQVDLHLGILLPILSRGPWQPGLVLEPCSRFARYSFRQDSRDISPDSASHDLEWLKVYSATLGLNSRFLFTDWNLEKPAISLDVFGCITLPYYTALGFVDKSTGEIKRIKTVWRGLDSEFAFLAGARFTFKVIGIFAEYRLTPTFSGDSPIPNLPRITFGLSILPPNQ